MNNVFAFQFVLSPQTRIADIWCMKSIKGIDALSLATEVSKLPDGTFTVAFYKYNAQTGVAETKLRTIRGCKARKQLPTDQFNKDSDNYFLFQDGDGHPKTCYRYLIRFMGFPNNNFELRKVEWLK